MSDLLARAAAIDATRAAFAGRDFAWGTADCLVVAHFHLTVLGHALPPIRPYRSAAGARRALKAMGADSVSALVDQFLEPIPHARILPGDLVAMPGQAGLDGLCICVGAKLLGWHEEAAGLVNILPEVISGAWRV